MSQSKCIPDYEAGILRELKCPVCFGYMLPPITLCQNGHNVCSVCKPKLQNCPNCRQIFLEVRNKSLEALAGETQFPCRNLNSGCTQRSTYLCLKDHEAECSFGNHRCPFASISKEKCDWCGRLSDMVKHITEAHMANTETLNANRCIYFQFKIPSTKSFGNQGALFKENFSFQTASSSTKTTTSQSYPVFGSTTRTVETFPSEPLPQPPSHCASQAILALEELFYAVFKVENNVFYCVVMHVAAREESSKFKYSLSISSQYEDVSYSLITASFKDDINKIFQDKNCVAVSGVSKFTENGKLKPKIEILKREENVQWKEGEGLKTSEKVKDLTLK